jgi:hypothetical protein
MWSRTASIARGPPERVERRDGLLNAGSERVVGDRRPSFAFQAVTM